MIACLKTQFFFINDIYDILDKLLKVCFNLSFFFNIEKTK